QRSIQPRLPRHNDVPEVRASSRKGGSSYASSLHPTPKAATARPPDLPLPERLCRTSAKFLRLVLRLMIAVRLVIQAWHQRLNKCVLQKIHDRAPDVRRRFFEI